MAEIKWIKITTDIFDDEKMKIIDTMPDRDALIVIWFKLLALTGKKNESGLLFLSPKMPYTDEMLATIFNRPLNTVRLALKTFESFEMIEINDNRVIEITNWEKHQNVEGMDKVRENNRLRQQKHRDKKKLQLEDNSNVTSHDNNALDKIRLDKNRLDKDKNNIIDNINELSIGNDLKVKLCEYVDYRKEIKKTLKTMRSITTTINKIGTDFTDEQHLIESIDNSIANEYQGIFPTKKRSFAHKQKPVFESGAARRLREMEENNMFDAEVVE